jgi:hypothetical protein
MGYQDNFPRISAATIAAFGESVTYVPGNNSIPAFFCNMDLGPVLCDVSDLRNALRDRRSGKILASVLVAAGVTSPTSQIERRNGDTVIVDGLTWQVSPDPGPRLENGEWILTLERNIRLVP